MTEAEISGLLICAYVTGFLHAWAVSHRDQPFWNNFCNGMSFRFLCSNRRNSEAET